MLRRQRGFTLLEVMIAVAIAAFLMTTIYGVFTSTSRARTQVEESSRQFHQARVFFERISRELRGSIWSPDNPETVFVSTKEDNKFKEIVFTTSAANRWTTGIDGMTVRYTLEKESEDLHTLYRVTSVAKGSEDGETSKYTIVNNISEMELRFYGNGAWFEKWNSEDEKQLPRMVEITLNIQLGKRDIPFSSTVDIPMALK